MAGSKMTKFLKAIMKNSEKLGITAAGIDSQGNIVVFVSDKRYENGVTQLASEYGVKVDVKHGEFSLMSGTFFHSWCGGKCICSPPQEGITCHHCASPQVNKSRAGEVGYLYNEERKEVGTTTILDCRPFRASSIFSILADIMCKLGLNFCGYASYVNKYDFAYVDYKPSDNNGNPVVGVIFAGIPRGDYAVAYDITNVDNLPSGINTDSIKNYMDKEVYAYVTHCMTKYCPVVKRRYKVVYEGFISVYAYNSAFLFTPVYFLSAVDMPLIVRYGDESEYVTWAVQPGYSGGVVRAPRS